MTMTLDAEDGAWTFEQDVLDRLTNNREAVEYLDTRFRLWRGTLDSHLGEFRATQVRQSRQLERIVELLEELTGRTVFANAGSGEEGIDDRDR